MTKLGKLLLLTALLLLLVPAHAHAYIGPGAGFALGGSFLAVLAAFGSALLLLLTWPVRLILRLLFRRRRGRSRFRRVVILGLDGLDHGLTTQFLAEGKLPHLEALRKQGCFKPLGSTLPPISPVAWSSFQTGVNPGKHNIFDFLTPDLRTYQPKLSSVDIRPPRRVLRFGKYQFPLGRASVRLLRKSKPFWNLLGDYGIFSSVLRVPITFPPEKVRGVLLSAMCVPDLRGTQGMFSHYTTKPLPEGEKIGGETHPVVRHGDTVRANLIGPENPFRTDHAVLKVSFVVQVKGADRAVLKIGGSKHELRRGVYTDWLQVDFRALAGIKVRGLCKFLLLGTEPHFELYVTPVNIDPGQPAMSISHPSVYSVYLSKLQGPFATLGLAEDTWALNEHVLNDDQFLQQCLDADREREVMFFDSLDKVQRGLCVVVFDGPDRLQHTFWRDIDPDHPAQTEHPTPPGRNLIEDMYRRMDDLVGRTMARCRDRDTLLMVISDHGFNGFRRGLDLNRWLEENGYLKLLPGRGDEEYLAGVDWSQTRAFALGLAGMFINLRGKYEQGIVEPGAEAEQLKEEIAGRLGTLVDPENGASAIRRVYITSKVYRGPYKDHAPDLIPGYQRGYRVSWETAIGRTTEAVFHDNTKAWSGDHCIDPALIPGVLFCNRPVETENPRLMDIAPTVLELFGVPVPEYMDGKVLAIGEAGVPLFLPSPLGGEGLGVRGSTRTRGAGAKRKRRHPLTPDPSPPRGEGRKTGGELMTDSAESKLNRRGFLKRSALAAVGAGAYWVGGCNRVSRAAGTKVIVIGIDGMDPVLSERMMKAGQLPNLAKLSAAGGFSSLGTSIPPQSPVAWANFINGAGPGSHGIFDFIHRHPEQQCSVFYSAAETTGGQTHLLRQGVPFWDFLDAAGVPTTFYDLPSNYPPSPSHHGHHRCISGMGTPDMLGTYGTYQQFAEDGPAQTTDEGSGKRSGLTFDNDTARATLAGPKVSGEAQSLDVDFLVHRDRDADAALIEIQGQKLLLKAGQWSRWTKLSFKIPWTLSSAAGICRFYLQEVAPNFRLHVSPINMDPSAPAQKMSEPTSFVQDVARQIGLFYTTGFQEEYEARKANVFADDEFLKQANMVLEERLALFDYAVQNYDDGLLFFYFSSSDLQSHIFWWDSDDKHPIRSDPEAKKYFAHVSRLYQKLDTVVGDLLDRYGSQAAIIVMSDHGFANFGTQFNLNSWLRDAGYLGPPECTSIMKDVDWKRTAAYGLGINGLYVNLKGRERDGIIEPGEQYEALLTELAGRLEAVTDANGEPVIRKAYRADQVYAGNATALAPDLIVGYRRGYRASWATCLGDLTEEFLLPNDSAWSADHCADALEVPGVLFTNRPLQGKGPALVDLAPSILAEFGLPTPASMIGRNIFS